MDDGRRAEITAALDADDQRARRVEKSWNEHTSRLVDVRRFKDHVNAHDPESTLRRNAKIRAIVAMEVPDDLAYGERNGWEICHEAVINILAGI